MSIDRRAGFTLIELIVFIVIVGVALAGVLTVFNVTVRGSADPVREKQALAAAESLLEEILSQSFCDPDTVTLSEQGGTAPSTCGTNTVEDSRNFYDDVDDYNSYTSIGIPDLGGGTALSDYNLAVQVAQPTADFVVNGAALVPLAQYRIVTVTATDTVTGRSYSLTGYKFNDD